MFFISSYSFFETHRRELIEFLAKQKKVFVACKMNKAKKNEKNIYFINANISNASMNILKITQDCITAFHILNKTREDKIFFVSTRVILLGIINSFIFSRKKFIFIFSGLGYLFISSSNLIKILRGIYLFALRQSVKITNSLCIVQNQDDYQFLASHGIRRENIKIIYGNGLDHRKFSEKCCEDLSKIKFLYVGRLLADKGVIEFLEASKKIANKFKGQALIDIVGGVDENNPACLDLEYLKDKYECNEIKFLGELKQSEVINLYEKYNIFVLPSYREGLPRAAIEASLSSMPLILTNVPGCKECLRDGYNGFFVKDRCVASIYEKMEYFINNPKIIHKMGVASRKFSIKKFSGDQIFEEYLKIFKE